jgi:hypothetical protein
MTRWLVGQLRLFAAWLEARQKPAPDFESFATKEELEKLSQSFAKVVAAQAADISKLKGENEKLSLRVGFMRPTQAGAGR